MADVRAFPAGTSRAAGAQRVAGVRGVARVGRRAPCSGRRLLETRFLPHVRLIAAAPVAHADETTARAEGALSYLHVACTRFLTAMHVGDRSRDTIDAAGIWPTFTGVLVRDGYAGYEHLDTIEHAWSAFIWSATCARSTTRPCGSVLGRGDGEYLAAGQ